MAGKALALLAIAQLIVAFPGWAAERVALVIGNAAYEQEAAALKNPVNDAKAVAAALRRLGFAVIPGTDLDEDAFYRKITEFEEAARSAEVALFFYAGHGLQVEGRNYLAPVDLRLRTKQDLRRHAIELGAALEVMRSETNVVILDACRNNPLAGELARSLGLSRAAVARRGLARVQGASGTLIAYATEPGSVAADGTGDHSPYTQALLAHMETPGLSVNDLFTRVTASVLENTDGRQKPWTHASLAKVVRFVSPTREARSPTPEVGCDREIDLEFWRSVRDSTHAADYDTYLSACPHGQFAALARNRLLALRSQEDTLVEPQATAQSEEAALGLGRDDRRLIQLGLAAAGFDPGPVDGFIGRGTRGAIKQWQASRDEAVTGFLDLETFKVLLAKGEKYRVQKDERRQAEAERRRDEREAAERVKLEREAQERARKEAEELARQKDDERARREAEAAARVPLGPNWYVADNQPCQWFFPLSKPGDKVFFTWSGGCVNRKLSGEGVIVWEWQHQTGMFKGWMRNGRPDGRGTTVMEDGSRYSGQWRNGELTHGMASWPNGSRYEGQWLKYKPHGQGTLTTTDGRYEGQWRNGCFGTRRGRWAALMTSPEACGFE